MVNICLFADITIMAGIALHSPALLSTWIYRDLPGNPPDEWMLYNTPSTVEQYRSLSAGGYSPDMVIVIGEVMPENLMLWYDEDRIYNIAVDIVPEVVAKINQIIVEATA